MDVSTQMASTSKGANSYLIGLRVCAFSIFLWPIGCAESLPRAQANNKPTTTPPMLFRGARRPALLGPVRVYSCLDIQTVYEAAMSIRWNYPQWTRVESCYQRRLSHMPHLRGEIELRVVINEKGVVTQATVVRDSTQDTLLQECVIRRVESTWSFPEPNGGRGDVVLTLKFDPVRGRTAETEL